MSRKEGLPRRKNPDAAAPLASGPDKEAGNVESEFWELRLYVAGKSARAETALQNLTDACESHLHGQYSIEVIDLLVNPQLAGADQIVALPTLIRRLPLPLKKIIGDLSDIERMLVGLDLRTPRVPR